MSRERINHVEKPLCPPGTQKHKGSIALWLIAALLVMSILSTSLATMAQATLSTGSSSKISLQAQQYAEAVSEIIKATKYDELAAHERTTINNSIYQDEVIIDPESIYPGNEDIKQKVCTVNIYRLDEQSPRYSLKVIRTSVSLDNSVPIGSILPYKGSLDDIPENWALCDGKNGTPDLRDRFIAGAGKTYSLGDTGGQYNIILTKDNLPKDAATSVSGSIITYFQRGNDKGQYRWSNNTDGGTNGNWCMSLGDFSATIFNGWNSTPIDNRPPYYALFYIMRIR